MKRLILYLALISCSVKIKAQNQITSNRYHLSKYERWNLKKYVHSHFDSELPKGSKPLLDFDALDNWPALANYYSLSISFDGRFVAYGISKDDRKKLDTLVVQSTSSNVKHIFTDVIKAGDFTEDGKKYVYQGKAGFCIFHIDSNQLDILKNVTSYKLIQSDQHEWLASLIKESDTSLHLQDLRNGYKKLFANVSSYSFDKEGKWLALKLNNETKDLLVYNLDTKVEQRFQQVDDYIFDKSGNALLLKTMEFINNQAVTSLKYIGLSNNITRIIWNSTEKNNRLGNYVLDGVGKQVLILIEDSRSQTKEPNKDTVSSGVIPNNYILYWRLGMEKPVRKISNQTIGIDSGYYIQGSPMFSNNNKYIQFTLKQQEIYREPVLDPVNVDIWNYKDKVLQSTQPYLLKRQETIKALFNLENDKLVWCDKEMEKQTLQLDDFAIISKAMSDVHGDRFWENNYYKDSNWLMSLKDGSRRVLSTKEKCIKIRISPSRNYLIYFDGELGCSYFSYDLRTDTEINISSSVPAWQFGYKDEYLRTKENPLNSAGSFIVGWLENDKGLLVYDNYDIWQLDLTGKSKPINITNGYGSLHKIQFELSGWGAGVAPVFNLKDTLLLKAFNKQTKFNGYYRKVLGKKDDPELLFMGPCYMEKVRDISGFSYGMPPLKAAKANIWVVKRQTAKEAPNYFVTRDFRNYKPLTNLQPQKKYNWISTELHVFSQLDGSKSQGVLYKPENFDSTKKYPVIISFYLNLSDNLYQFPSPEYISSPIIHSSPGWMVSHGYLVFAPDIYFIQGKWGPSVLNTLDGAAKYLQSLPFVDGRHIGACGHSNSGRFGYYLLTHSKSFAAMSIGSGYCGTDYVSAALSLQMNDNETSNLEFAERNAVGAGGLGNLWKNKDLWIDHTAVLHADKVTSPLLLFHNKRDGDDVRLAVELFIALRRLEMRSWWLQYDDGRHTLVKANDMKDFTVRYTQFFDHYLKGAPPPSWMTRGISTASKGFKTGYDLDYLGTCSTKGKEECNVCKKWNQQNRNSSQDQLSVTKDE